MNRSIYFSKEMEKEIKKLAKAGKVSISQVVRDLIEKGLKNA